MTDNLKAGTRKEIDWDVLAGQILCMPYSLTDAQFHRLSHILSEACEILKQPRDPMGFSAAPSEEAVVVERSGSAWTEPDVQDLARRVYRAPSPLRGARAAMELWAEHPDRWVTYGQVHERSGNENLQQTRAELGALTKYIVKARQSKAWPVEVETSPILQYRSTALVSRWISNALIALGVRR